MLCVHFKLTSPMFDAKTSQLTWNAAACKSKKVMVSRKPKRFNNNRQCKGCLRRLVWHHKTQNTSVLPAQTLHRLESKTANEIIPPFSFSNLPSRINNPYFKKEKRLRVRKLHKSPHFCMFNQNPKPHPSSPTVCSTSPAPACCAPSSNPAAPERLLWPLLATSTPQNASSTHSVWTANNKTFLAPKTMKNVVFGIL